MICLAAAGLLVSLGGSELTLRWRHSVEKTEWEETWREVEGRLELTMARVRGSGAGMEPSPEARFEHGSWFWRPAVPPLREVVLRRSGAAGDWSLCLSGNCRPMGDYVPPSADPVVLTPCPSAVLPAVRP